jgi:hypothetical protein
MGEMGMMGDMNGLLAQISTILIDSRAMKQLKVGQTVWYVVEGGDYQQAKILAVNSATEYRIVLQTGPQKGTELDVPSGVLSEITT